VEVVQATASTNAVVADRARAGEEPGLVLVTEHQTAGRGRLDRVWETPARTSLTFSVLVRPDVPPAAWSWLPLLAGYAVQAALADRLPDIALKWPNDVLVDSAGSGVGRKVAGILVERVDTASGPMAVVGIGINVDQTLDELPVALATSVVLETGEPVDRTELLGMVLGSLHGLQGLLDDVDGLRAAYADVCSTLGRTVDVHLPSGEVRRGEALDLDASGALVLSTAEGTFTVAAGDVVHVRPTP
jgi:BirA family biotin operon repressor/biotin-[acetyl-CoA-carboxylase] ligase